MLEIRAQESGNTTILCLQGRIMVGETNALRCAVHSQSDIKAVVLDMNQVIGIDAAGLGMLLELREWSVVRGIEFRLMNLTECVEQVLEVTRLNSVFKISSEAEVRFLATSGRPNGKLAFVHCDQLLRNENGRIGIGNMGAPSIRLCPTV